MQRTLFIRLDGESPEQAEWWLESPDAPTRTGRGELGEAARLAHGSRVIALVPTSDVLLTTVSLPTTQRQRLRRAVPYALEDQLAEDVESLHFALGKPGTDGRIPVAVVRREQMDRWHAQLKQAELRPHAMIPTVLALPKGEGWTLLVESHQTLLRTSSEGGFMVEPQSLAVFLPLALEQEENAPASLTVYDWRPEEEKSAASIPRLSVETMTGSARDTPALLTRGYAEGPPVDLLQGDYSRQEQLGRLWRPWRAAATVALAWMLIEGISTLGEYHELSQMDEQLESQIEQTYREAFPDARHIVDPRVQMERRLEALRGGGSADAFAMLLGTAGPVLKQSEGVELRSLRYREGVLDLDLGLKDLSSLDALKKRFAEQGLEVKIQTASTQGGKVESRLELREAGA